MRIIKKHDDRKNEIIDIAEALFYTKGFSNCTVNDILKEAGIAKGTFYHYFKTKEETMDAVIEKNIGIIENRVLQIIRRDDLEPVEKLMNALMAMRMDPADQSQKIDDLHKPENALMHQKSLHQLIVTMGPVFVGIIEEGINKKVWTCRYPLPYIQIFLASAITLTDEGIFENASDSQVIMIALISVLEKMLEVKEDSFVELFLNNQFKNGKEPL